MDTANRQIDGSCIQIGALAPLSRPGWIDAGRHLLAGLELGIQEVNASGGISGRELKLVVRDTAADTQKATAAVDELAGLGVAALVGEYHSVVARHVAARAETVGIPYLCSSAVIDELTEEPTNWVARLAPAQSRGWRIYADFLLAAGHSSIAIAADPASIYWTSGSRIVRKHLAPCGGTVIEFDMRDLTPTALCDELVRQGDTTALLLLVSQPEPAVSIVEAVHCDKRLAGVMIGAPAGQPELAEWAGLLRNEGAGIPFLRYLPEQLSPLGARIEATLHEKLSETPSFVAFEGYDTITVLQDLLHSHGADQMRTAPPSWSSVDVQGTRGQINFSRILGINVWQWAWAPIQVADRDPVEASCFRALYLDKACGP